QRRVADDARIPAHARLHDEVAPLRAVAHDLGPLDVGHARGLGGGVVQEPVARERLARDPAEGGENLLIVAYTLQDRAFAGVVAVCHASSLEPWLRPDGNSHGSGWFRCRRFRRGRAQKPFGSKWNGRRGAPLILQPPDPDPTQWNRSTTVALRPEQGGRTRPATSPRLPSHGRPASDGRSPRPGRSAARPGGRRVRMSTGGPRPRRVARRAGRTFFSASTTTSPRTASSSSPPA